MLAWVSSAILQEARSEKESPVPKIGWQDQPILNVNFKAWP